VRVSNIHIVASLIPSLLLLAVLLERSLNDRLMARILMVALCAFTVLITLRVTYEEATRRLYTDSSVFDQLRSAWGSTAGDTGSRWCERRQDLPKIACFTMGADRDAAAAFLARNTQPRERIFVGLGRHDKIFVNDNMTYFAADRLPATRWHHFDPGLQTTAAVQKEIVDELEAHRVRYILLSPEWDDVAEPNDSAKSSGVVILDEYIRRHYRPEKAFGKLSLWVRVH
jgi:hypothetical protein